MAAHWHNLTPDEQALVRLVQPHREHATPRTRRWMMRNLGWSQGKFYNVQRALIGKGWPLKPTAETVTVRGAVRPLYRILRTEDEYEHNAQRERTYNTARVRTGRAVQRQGERDNPLSEPIFNEEQRLKVAGNILRGERTAVPIGHSENDPTLKREDNGDTPLSDEELARLLAPMLKQHPNHR